MPTNYSWQTTLISSTPSCLVFSESGDDGTTFTFYPDGTYKSDNEIFSNLARSLWKIEDGMLFYCHNYADDGEWYLWANPFSELKTVDIVMNWMIESAIFND
jgi:hypothetical protein